MDILSLEKRSDGVAVIYFDVKGEDVNTLQRGFDQAFEDALATIDEWSEAQAVVLTSGKDGSFVAGADVTMLQDITEAYEARELAETAQHTMNQMVAFRLPIVAAIDGACLGGGLELAMACDQRVASNAHHTTFAQPEVNLGLIPGAGSTQRLPRLIGIEKALELILTGKTIRADYAHKLGLVDEIVHPNILIDVAVERALHLAENGSSDRSGSFSIKKLLLEENAVGRKILFDQARERTEERTHGNYSAPLKAIDVLQTGAEEGMLQGLQAEADAFAELVVSPQAQNMMRVFFMQRRLKKDADLDADTQPRTIRKVGVVGGGLMGSGIAYITATEAETPVRLRDINNEAVRGALRSIHSLLHKGVDNHKITPQQRDRYAALVSASTTYQGFQRADLVIEAVFEDLDIKHQVLNAVEEYAPDDVIFASNTSSLPITRIAEASQEPGNVVGMHYFSPVYARPLLEVVRGEKTTDDVIATCVDIGHKQGKAVIVVNDGPGFYTTRILAPYINEALYMLLEGVPIEDIDEALVHFGFPMGPIRLLDEVGLQVMEEVGGIMHDAFGDRMSPPPGVEKMLENERQGEKNGRGFYNYTQNKGDYEEDGVDQSVYTLLDVTPESKLPPDEIARRCTLQMLNEAAHCYGEGILRSAFDGDAGAILGLGFPPFRGGPFTYANHQGLAHILEHLEGYRDEYGSRFEPAPIIRELAASGSRFPEDDTPRPGTRV